MDKFMLAFFIISMGIIGWIASVNLANQTPKEICQFECRNAWTERPDWTCVKSCYELKGLQ